MNILKEFTDFAVNSGWCVDGETTQNGFLFYNAQTNDRWIGWQAAQAVPEWVSVKDELPSEGDLLLGISTTKLTKFNVYQVVALDEFDDCEITHWMHLPQAPKDQEQSHDSKNS